MLSGGRGAFCRKAPLVLVRPPVYPDLNATRHSGMRTADVVEGRNGVLLARGEFGLPQFLKLVRRHYERVQPRLVRQSARAPRAARTRRVSRRTTRACSSRDGPGLADPDEPPDLDHLRPLTAEVRTYLKAAVDARRREILAACPEVSPEVFHLFDEDRA
jgi:hypothetical protein